MTKIILLFISLLSFSLCAQETERVLFIGNSYTYYNNMPSLLEQAASSTGDNIIQDQSTFGGATLFGHTTHGETLSKIMQGDWDYVVLQEQSQRPSLSDSYVEINVYPYATQLNELIEEHNPCVETVFYMTWGRKDGDGSNCATWPPVCTYEGMDDLLKQRYLIMAEDNEAVTSPVGAVWRYLRENHPELELYDPDGSHPSLIGSYAAAITFYTTIFKKDPNLVSFNSSLSNSDANKVKNAIKTVVFNNFSEWLIDSYNPIADFEYSNNGNLEYTFTNTSTFTNSNLWEFGDGNYSLEENPIHSYAEEGSYEVTLTTNFECSNSSSKTKTLNITLSVDYWALENSFSVWPNPFNDVLNIQLNPKFSNKVTLEIFDITGQLKASYDHSNRIDLTAFSNNIYFLVIKENNQILALRKVVKK